MKRMTPLLLALPFVALGCQDRGPTNPLVDEVVPLFAVDCDLDKFKDHPQCVGGGGDEEPGVTYQFAYLEDQAEAIATGQCWRPHWEDGYEPTEDDPVPTEPLNWYGRDFRCPIPAEYLEGGESENTPLAEQDYALTLNVQVLDGEGAPVESGTVTFFQCVDVSKNEAVLWHYCGVRGMATPQDKKNYKVLPYGEPVIVSGGSASVLIFSSNRTVDYIDISPNQPPELGWPGLRWIYDDGARGEQDSGWRNVRPYPQGDPYATEAGG
jgi:hypothetical protein